MNFYNAFMEYFKKETVLQGYDPTVGWMHTIAHSADLFEQVVKSKEMNKRILQEIFEAIKDKFTISNYNYISDEDERMVTAIIAALQREILEEDYLIDWIHQFGKIEKPKTYPENYNFKNNVKNLLRSLYFRLTGIKEYKTIRSVLEEVIIAIEKKR